MSSPIRNIGIIAHVDHGKTTLVDAIFRQAGTFRENQHMQERIMDSNELEREKGITILSKVASVRYRDYKINIVDTPGHADFGGEVERVLSMVDGVLLVVDACEGPMPQTRFVLKKAFQHGLKPIVCINKVDREGAIPLHAYDKTLDLFIDLGASEADLFFPHLFTSGAAGFARVSPDGGEQDMRELFEMIINAVPPPSSGDGQLLMQINNLDYSDYMGRMFGGKVLQGQLRVGDRLNLLREDKSAGFNVTKLWIYEGIQLAETDRVETGEIGMMSGLDDVLISDTIADPSITEPLSVIAIEPPTLTMSFYANQSPLAGKDGGKFLTIQKIRERLEKEAKVSVALKIDTETPAETVKVYARGELQLAILIETMRREGYETAISRPKVIMKKDSQGKTLEPIERISLEFPEEYMGPVMEELSRRKGEMKDMVKDERGIMQLEYVIPTRGLIGFRSNYLTLTRGFGVVSQLLEGHEPHKGEVTSRTKGAIISKESGKITRYAYEDVQERGQMFYPAGTEVYPGMIIGECSRDEDMVVNITKAKQMTNMRAASADATVVLDQHRDFSLEQALAWLRDDELLEVTPKMLRFRKAVLDHGERRVAERRAETIA
ncbi:MAG: translational GTPase TypA [Fimbriimonadales bacterium]